MPELDLASSDRPIVERPLPLMLVLYAVGAVTVAAMQIVHRYDNNFIIYRAASQHLLTGANLYGAYPGLHSDFFKYSPTFAFLFLPFSQLPLPVALALWTLTCSLALWVALARLLPPNRAAVALAIAFVSVIGDLQRAQSNTLCAALMIIAFSATENGRPWRAAWPIAAGTFIKIFPIGAAALAIFHARKTRFALALVVAGVVLFALPLVATSPHSLLEQYRWWGEIEARDALILPHRFGGGGGRLYAGLMGQFRVWWGVQWPNWPTQLVGAAALLLPLVRRSQWTDSGFRQRFLASLLVFSVLFNHQSESPSFAIAMIGIGIWYAISERTWWRTSLVAAALLIIGVGSSGILPRDIYRAIYVRYLLKTVPLIPVWLTMQAELLGWMRVATRASDVVERGEHEITPPEAFAHGS
jgi:hypothetical protein